MKQIIYVVIATLLFSIPMSVDAQDIKWGPHYKKEGGLFARYNVVGSDDDHYYLNMRPRKKGGTLLKFDYNHKLKSTTNIDLKYGKEKLIPQSFIKTASKTFAYMPKYDKGEFQVYVSEFNSGKFGKVRKAHEHKYKKQVKVFYFGLSTYTNRDAGGNKLKVSKNKKYVAFSNAYSTIDKKTLDKIGFVVFDENMKVVWKKEQDFPYRDKDFNVKQVIVSNKGEIFFTATVSEKKKRKDKDKNELQFEYKVFHITEGSMSEVDIKLARKNQVNDAGLFIQEATNQVYLGGFYTEYGKKTAINGTFFGEVDVESKDVLINTHKFTDDFMEGLARKKDIEKGRGISYSYNIGEMISFSNGTFSFLAENYYVTTHTTYSNGKSRTYYVYHSNAIVIPRFDKDGELINIEKIDKKFSSRSSAEVSYSSNAYDGKIFIVFNDAKTKAEKKDIKKSGMKKGRRFTDLCIIDAEGKIGERKTIFTNKETDSFYVPMLSFDHKDKLVLGTVTAMFKKYKFGTMRMK
jgi:hypothetical protein